MLRLGFGLQDRLYPYPYRLLSIVYTPTSDCRRLRVLLIEGKVPHIWVRWPPWKVLGLAWVLGRSLQWRRSAVLIPFSLEKDAKSNSFISLYKSNLCI